MEITETRYDSQDALDEVIKNCLNPNDYSYIKYKDRYNKVLRKETDLTTGHIDFDDAVFLPNGTYVMVHEDGKEPYLGKVMWGDYISNDNSVTHSTSICSPFCEMNFMDKKFVPNGDLYKEQFYFSIPFPYLIDRTEYDWLRNENHIWFQLVNVEFDETDIWKPICLEWCLNNGRRYLKHLWKYIPNGHYYYEKDLQRKFYEDPNVYYRESPIKEENFGIYQKEGYNLVPGEGSMYLIYVLLSLPCIIFKDGFGMWIAITICMLIERKHLRSKWGY